MAIWHFMPRDPAALTSLSRRRDQPAGRRTERSAGPEQREGLAAGPQRGWGRGKLLLFLATLAASHLTTLAQARALQIQSITLTVSDLGRAAAFYTGALGFTETGRELIAAKGHDLAVGVGGSQVLRATLRLGDETLVLDQYLAPPGKAYPSDSRAQDRWFQHFAIVVRDMDRAVERVSRFPIQAISTAPQTLPESNQSAAGIRAYKFRDPDGHPLELLQFPTDKGRAKWHRPGGGVFLGIDHSAFTVADTDADLVFWRDLLGLTVAGGSLNTGITQENLDGAPGAVVRVTGLRPDREEGPGVEFLQYLAPADGRPTPEDQRANDLAHAHVVLEVDDVDDLAARLQARGRAVSSRVVCKPGDPYARRFMARDPDGHAVMLVQRSQPGETCK